jgi:hypothetical protein
LTDRIAQIVIALPTRIKNCAVTGSSTEYEKTEHQD